MNSQLSLAVAETRRQDMLLAAAEARRAAGLRRASRIARLRGVVIGRRPNLATAPVGRLG